LQEKQIENKWHTLGKVYEEEPDIEEEIKKAS